MPCAARHHAPRSHAATTHRKVGPCPRVRNAPRDTIPHACTRHSACSHHVSQRRTMRVSPCAAQHDAPRMHAATRHQRDGARGACRVACGGCRAAYLHASRRPRMQAGPTAACLDTHPLLTRCKQFHVFPTWCRHSIQYPQPPQTCEALPPPKNNNNPRPLPTLTRTCDSSPALKRGSSA
eukprot:364750-Chlamydomonas_euryale.AAC.4